MSSLVSGSLIVMVLFLRINNASYEQKTLEESIKKVDQILPNSILLLKSGASEEYSRIPKKSGVE